MLNFYKNILIYKYIYNMDFILNPYKVQENQENRLNKIINNNNFKDNKKDFVHSKKDNNNNNKKVSENNITPETFMLLLSS